MLCAAKRCNGFTNVNGNCGHVLKVQMKLALEKHSIFRFVHDLFLFLFLFWFWFLLDSKTLGTNVLELQYVLLCWQTMIKT